MGKHRVIPCTPPADPDALLVDDATAREHIDTLRDVTTEIARTVAGLDGRATPHDVQQKLAAVLAGLLSGMNLTMLVVALQWPLRALEPVLPLALLFAAIALSTERLLIQRLATSISGVHVVL